MRSLSKQIDTLWNFVDEIKIPGLDDGVNLQHVEESTESETQEDAEEEDVKEDDVEEKEDDGEDGEGRCNKKRRLDHPWHFLSMEKRSEQSVTGFRFRSWNVSHCNSFYI